MKKQTRKTKKKPSTALAVRKPQQLVVSDPQKLLPQVDLSVVGQLGEIATVGALGLAEVTLTAAEEAVLSEPVNASDIMVRPDGVAYLPHIVYTRWFGRAFGRLGWSIVPTGKPQKAGNAITVPYMLYVHGKPVAFAWGEQDYHETNARQSFGDAIESTVASALRRCAKRLGVGLEMWDKAFLASIKSPQQGKQAQSQPKATTAQPSQRQVNLTDEPVISEEQQTKLWNTAKKHGRAVADVTLWLRKVYKVNASASILRKDYAGIIAALEARGELPMEGDG